MIRRNLQNLLLVALAAVMMSFGWMELTGLVMLAGLIPMLILASRYDGSGRSFWKMLGWTILFITLWYALSIRWVWNSTPAGPLTATVFAYIFTGLPFMFWFFVSKRAPKALSYTLLVSSWTVGEWIYNTDQASFPWLDVGNGFAHDIWLVQWYEWTGVYGGTIWVLLANIIIYECLVVRRPRRWMPPAMAVLVPPLISIIIFFTYNEPEATAKITVVQPNIELCTEKSALPQQEQTANMVDLMSHAPADVDFIVMPETAINEGLAEDTPAGSGSLCEIRQIAEEKYPEATVVVGAATYSRRGDVCAATGICRESIRGRYYTKFVLNGAQVMFIIANDGCRGDTPGYRQRFDYARLRAVETRRAIVRSANTGRSGFINTRGDVLETLGRDVRGTITDDVPFNSKITLYVRFGDYLGRISLLVLGLSILYFIAYRVRKKDLIVD